MSNLPPQLLDVLRCPVTGSRLLQDGGVLRSTDPGPDGESVQYGLDEGIPVLLPAGLLPGTARS